MRGRARRQTWRKTNRELHRTLSADGRKWVKEVWAAAEEVSQQPALLGELATVVGTGVVEDYAARQELEGDGSHQALSAVMRIGYAARAVLAGPTEQPSLDAAAFGVEASFAVEQTSEQPAAVRELVDRVRSIAVADFDSVMTLPDPVWASYVAMATRKLQRRLGESVSWRELSRERVDGLLRHGYVLRCLDEALEDAPAMRNE